MTIKDVKSVSGGAGSQAFAAFGTNPAAGDMIAVFVAVTGATKVVTAPTDSRSNTYTQIGTQTGGGNTQLALFVAKNVAAGATTVTANGTWSNMAAIAWLVSGTSVDPYNNDVFGTFGTTSGANSAFSGPTTQLPYPGSIFLTGITIAAVSDMGLPTGYNTTGVNGFTAGMLAAAKKLDWSANEDCQTAYKIGSAVETPTWPTSPGFQQWATLIASFAPPKLPLPTSSSPNEGQTTGGEATTITGTAGSFGTWVTGVTFDGVAATNVVVVNSSTITCTTPAHAGTGLVDVVVTGTEGNGTIVAGYRFSVRPYVTSLSPQYLLKPVTSAIVTITGSSFVSGATVKFNGVSATNVVFVSSTTITCTPPDGATGACVVAVTNP